MKVERGQARVLMAKMGMVTKDVHTDIYRTCGTYIRNLNAQETHGESTIVLAFESMLQTKIGNERCLIDGEGEVTCRGRKIWV